MVFLTHRNPLARPSDHRSPPSCVLSALQMAPSATRLQRRTFAKHDAGVADACCLPLWWLKLRTSHHNAWKGMCGEGGLLDPSFCTHPVAQRSRRLCIFPQFLAAATACVAIDIRSHTFDFVNCRHSVSRNASVCAS